MADGKKVYTLSEPVVFKIRDKEYIFYPLSFSQLIKVKDKLAVLEKLEKSKDMGKIIEASSDITFTILKDFNDNITKKEIMDTFTLQAFQTLISECLGIPNMGQLGTIDKT